MVFVGVGNPNGLERTLMGTDERHIWYHGIDAGHVVAGEHLAAIDHDHLAFERIQATIQAELANSPEGDNVERTCSAREGLKVLSGCGFIGHASKSAPGGLLDESVFGDVFPPSDAPQRLALRTLAPRTCHFGC